jgi:hypothetical protein
VVQVAVVAVMATMAVLAEQEMRVVILQLKVMPEEMLAEQTPEALVVVAQVLWVLLVALRALVVQEPHPQ